LTSSVEERGARPQRDVLDHADDDVVVADV
jgi:hypothetical protein